MKRIYIQPNFKVVRIKSKHRLLSGSVIRAKAKGLDGWDEDGYDQKGGDAGEAW